MGLLELFAEWELPDKLEEKTALASAAKWHTKTQKVNSPIWESNKPIVP